MVSQTQLARAQTKECSIKQVVFYTVGDRELHQSYSPVLRSISSLHFYTLVFICFDFVHFCDFCVCRFPAEFVFGAQGTSVWPPALIFSCAVSGAILFVSYSTCIVTWYILPLCHIVLLLFTSCFPLLSPSVIVCSLCYLPLSRRISHLAAF
jgi:hypothetical protein